MKSGDDIESYLIRMEASFESLGENIWLVKDSKFDMVVSIAGSVLVFRVKLLDVAVVPASSRERFFRTLLELNASEMIHGAYGLEQDAVVATDALQLENLDFNEFQAALEDIALAVGNHYPILKGLTLPPEGRRY